MPSIAATHPSSDRLDPFLIAGPPTAASPSVVGLEDFLAAPPIPADPTPSEAAAGGPTPTSSGSLAPLAEPTQPASPARALVSEVVRQGADLPILPSFNPVAAAPSDVAPSFGVDEASLIAAPAVIAATSADTTGSAGSPVAAGVEEGGGGDVLSALAANPLDDGLLADPSALLSAAPLSARAGAGADASGRSADRLDSWPSDASSGSVGVFSRFGPIGSDSSPAAAGVRDVWGPGDDRSSTGPDALGQVEGRLSRAVAKLEEAVAALSAPGPVPLGSRPRGFRGRIDA